MAEPKAYKYIDQLEGDASSTDDEDLDAPVLAAKKAGEKRLQRGMQLNTDFHTAAFS